MTSKAVVANGGTASSTNAAAGSPEADLKLLWAILGEMSKAGKLQGIDWECVMAAIGTSTVKTTQNRWYSLKDRMWAKGCALPVPDSKSGRAPATPRKKAKAALVAADNPATPAGTSCEDEVTGDIENPATTTANSTKKRKAATSLPVVDDEDGGEDGEKSITTTISTPMKQMNPAAATSKGEKTPIKKPRKSTTPRSKTTRAKKSVEKADQNEMDISSALS